jgi:hypothetical protein
VTVTAASENKKLNGDGLQVIACTEEPESTCPPCPLKGHGCYAGWIFGFRGRKLKHSTPAEVAWATSDGRPIRFFVVGDYWTFPKALELFLAAHRSRAAWGYTHSRNLHEVYLLNRDSDVTLNLSANTLKEADTLRRRGPTVCLIPTKTKVQHTPEGARVVWCPQEWGGTRDCVSCGGSKAPLCARKERDYVIGFYPHGAQARKALEVASDSEALQVDGS